MNIEKEQEARKYAIWVIVIMTIIWIILSIFSFTDTKDRVRPRTANIEFEGVGALKGKQVFQAYNCMDCHTIVGNGAYFAPDLTKINELAGPAWLKAYLGSPGTYPTKAIVDINLKQLLENGHDLPGDIDAYLDAFPAAKDRVENRGGVDALMPNLQFTAEEINALIAYFQYTELINTGGWPPKVIADPEVIEYQSRKLEEKSGFLRNLPKGAPIGGNADDVDAGSPVALGASIAQEFACVACHSSDGSEVVGPTFKGLFQSERTLDNGKKVVADEEYLRRSILDPNNEIIKGYPFGVMPSFEGMLDEDQLSAVLEYIKSLK